MNARLKQYCRIAGLGAVILTTTSCRAKDSSGAEPQHPTSQSAGSSGLADRLDPVQEREQDTSGSRDGRQDAVTRLSPRPIVDRDGFGVPIEAYSILVPVGWDFDSEVVWFGTGGRCGPGYAQPVFKMESPDGRYAIEVAAGFHIEMTSVELDRAAANSFYGESYLTQQRQVQQQMEAMRRAYRSSGSHCRVARASSPREMVDRMILPALRPASRVIRVEPDPAIRGMLQPLEQAGDQMRAMSGYGMSADQVIETTKLTLEGTDRAGDRSREIVKFGTVGYRMAQVLEGLAPNGLQMLPMGQFSYTVDETTWVTAYRAPPDELDAFESLAGAIIGSLRSNPRWQAAFDRFLWNITRIQNQGAMERSRIMAETNDAISDMQMEGWRRRQDSQDRSARAFVNSIRGVEQRIDPSTGYVVDVPDTGYEYYSDGQGNILIVDTPGVDPRELFPLEDWQVMRRP